MAIAFDGPNQQINLSIGTVEMNVRDLWSRWVDWWLTDDNSKYGIWMFNIGGDDINETEGTKVPIFLFMDPAVKIKPQEADHTLGVIEGVLIVQGGGEPFMHTTGSHLVQVNYQQPVQAIAFTTDGSGGLTVDQATMLIEIHRLMGLDASNPMTVTPTSREAGAITQVISGDGETTSTVTRT